MTATCHILSAMTMAACKIRSSVAVILATTAVAVATLYPTDAVARDVFSLDTGWTFFLGDATDTDNAATVNLPHTWNSDAAAATGSYFRGTGNYIKDIDISPDWEGKRIFLRVGGAATVADVFVNSSHVASHEGGNSAFTVELTNRLRYGHPNNIRIVVSNSPRLDVMPTAGEKNVYGGIFRDVELLVCEPLSVSPLVNGGNGVWVGTTRLTDERVDGTVKVELLDMADHPVGARARIRFTDADERVVAQNTLPIPEFISDDNSTNTTVVTLPFSVSKPRLWNGLEDPHLYNVEITLTTQDGTMTDSLSIRTGFRTLEVSEDNKFVLNGRPLRIRGVIVHRDRMMAGTALRPFQIQEDVNMIREMGANAVRVAGGQHSDLFYSLCDEAGIIVWNDTPFVGAAYPTDIDFVDTDRFRTNGSVQLTEMITQLYNHPSVAVWGIYSNVSMRGDNPIPYIRELNNLAHRLDPGRLTAASSVRDGEINSITDLISFDLSFGWGDNGMPGGVQMWIDQLSKWRDLPAGISYSAGASIFHQTEGLDKPAIESNMHPEGWQTFFHEEYVRCAVDAPQLWGVFVGNMFDFGSSLYRWGEGKGINDEGLVTFDRKDRKDAYWIYKANWNTVDPFVHITSKRLETRTNRSQTIKVYSNQPEVELFVAGRSVGKRTGERGVFIWNDINLRVGENRLEARGGSGVSDNATINIDTGTSSRSGYSESGATSSTRPSGAGVGRPSLHRISNLR